jgi:hypothetical protein
MHLMSYARARLLPRRALEPRRGLAPRALAILLFACPAAIQAQTGDGLPLKHTPQPTQPAITAGDLETRLYIYADDSMAGRRAGTEGDLKATAYIASEFKRLKLVPAGDSGTYFQNIPLVTYAFDTTAPLTVGGQRLTLGRDFLPVTRRQTQRIDGLPVVYGGQLCDSGAARLTEAQAEHKVVIYNLPADPAAQMACLQRGDRVPLAKSAGVVLPGLQALPPQIVPFLAQPLTVLRRTRQDTARGPLVMLVTPQAARAFMPRALDSAAIGDAGATVERGPVFSETPATARNVVAILPGSDPKLKHEYVALGAHNDHLGITSTVDHDSIRAYNQALHRLGAVDPFTPLDSAKVASVHINMDSLHRLRQSRRDSIDNGADDDGSGTVALLEIAENLAAEKQRSKRSILFVSHTAEELGLFGSEYFTDHPTVPRDSIVAQLNMDMIGRGDAADIVGGGPRYLQLVGSRRLSTELGDIVEAVNKSEAQPFVFDYQFDANGHPENIYCRSDHYEYARYGIPIVFFTTGQHSDYHQVTDEPEYIDYDHLARVASFVRDVALRLADLDHRPVVDKPKPDPHGVCRQ